MNESAYVQVCTPSLTSSWFPIDQYPPIVSINLVSGQDLLGQAGFSYNTLYTKQQGTNHNFLLLLLAHACTNAIISAFLRRMQAADQKPDYHLEWPNR